MSLGRKIQSEKDIPKTAKFVGADDAGPGEVTETTLEIIESESFGKHLVYLEDEDGFRSFFVY